MNATINISVDTIVSKFSLSISTYIICDANIFLESCSIYLITQAKYKIGWQKFIKLDLL